MNSTLGSVVPLAMFIMVIPSQRWVIRRIGFYQQPSPVVSELEKLMDDLLEFAF